VTVSAVVLQINDPEVFVEELRRRGIRVVRATSWWRRLPYLDFEVKRRFTAFDRDEGVILRLDVTYYRGVYTGSPEHRRAVEEACRKKAGPIEEQIRRVAEILDGEYHNGEARW
jgi:hypothetical protein